MASNIFYRQTTTPCPSQPSPHPAHTNLTHPIRPPLGRHRRKKPHIHIIIPAQLLQRRQHLTPHQLLAPLRPRHTAPLTLLLELRHGGVLVRQALEQVDEHGVRLGDVEADIGDRVVDELGEDGENGAGEDGEGEGGG